MISTSADGVACAERKPRRETVLCRVGLEMRPHRRQIEADAIEMGMCPRKLDREAALCGADIGEALVVSPRKFLRNGVRGAKAQPRHCLEELREYSGVAVYLVEQVATLL